MKLTYSEYNTYLKCPRLYDHVCRKVVVDYTPSEYFSLYGRLVESFFKKYVNDFLPNNIIVTEALVKDSLTKLWKSLLEKSYVDWKEPWCKENADQLFERSYNDVLKNIQALDFWKHAQSEVTIELILKKSQDIIKGRLDFLVKYPDGKIAILDGKGTRKIDTNVDVDQLYFYALVYFLSNKRLPDQIGFLYYQYQMIKYVDIDLDILTKFRNKLLIVKSIIQKDTAFEAKVKLSKHCLWCIYKFDCVAYNNKKDANREKRKKINLPDMEGGVVSLCL